MEKLKLLHCSPIKNYDSILENGLLINSKSSGYGKEPLHKDAIYLYYKNNIDVPSDMLDMFKNVDIWLVAILDIEKLIADEDSNCDNWIDSLETIGTCAYKGNIKNVKHLCRFKK